MPASVRVRYEALARGGELAPDPGQRLLADRLDALATALKRDARKIGWRRLGRLFGGVQREPPRGLYIWGEVGRGKTLLMDLFVSVAAAPQRRVHFHAFMAEVHDRIESRRRRPTVDGRKGDPIPLVAAEIAAEIELLCFDEFHVHDIADAMILGRLFEHLFANGVTVVATSNVAPDHLYKDGLNRGLFLPFISLLKRHMAVFHLEAPRDFRLDASGGERRYVVPLGLEANACLDAHFHHLSGGGRGEAHELTSKGRRIVVPQAADGIARFTFDDLCARPLGAGDYLKIADTFHTLILADVPALDATKRNEAKRLINLIDTIYDHRVRLIVSAAAEPTALWRGEDGIETMEFARTASRLVEMRSDAYWEASAFTAQTKKARAD